MSDNVLSCSKQKWQLLTCRSVFAFLGKFTGPPALRRLPSNWMHRRPGICYCFLFVIVFYLLLLLFFRKESCSTLYWFSPFLYFFVFLGRKHQKTPTRAKHCEMMKHGCVCGFQPVPSHMSLQITSKQLVEFQMLVRPRWAWGNHFSHLLCHIQKTDM